MISKRLTPTRLLQLIVLVFIVTTPLYADTPRSDFQQLIKEVRLTIRDRLVVMTSVARYKWANQLPIEDLAREKTVIKNTVNQAKAAGLKPGYAVNVVSAQIKAAKQVQLGWFQRWKLVPGSEARIPLEDLDTDIRPAITEITERLILQLVSLKSFQLTCKHIAQLEEVPKNLQAYAEAWHTAANGIVPQGLKCK